MIKSLPYLGQGFKGHVLVVIGTGKEKYTASLMALVRKLGVKGQIRFLGYVEEDVKISALDAAIVLVLPSVAPFETFPIVISEAWARGKPVIASAVGALPYRVRHMENGALVPAGDPKALAESMAEILSDRNLQRRLGVAGRKGLMTWEQVAELTEKLYEEIAS